MNIYFLLPFRTPGTYMDACARLEICWPEPAPTKLKPLRRDHVQGERYWEQWHRVVRLREDRSRRALGWKQIITKESHDYGYTVTTERKATKLLPPSMELALALAGEGVPVSSRVYSNDPSLSDPSFWRSPIDCQLQLSSNKSNGTNLPQIRAQRLWSSAGI